MKDTISNQLVKYLEARGVEHVFGLCGHTNIAVLAALSRRARSSSSTCATSRSPRTRPTATRARRSRRRSCCRTWARASPTRHRRGQRGARFGADGGDRRRRADALLRQASAPGSEPARGCVAVRDLPPVRQARLARRPARTCFRRSSRRPSRWPRAAARARCWSTCRWTSSRRRSTSRCSSACGTTPRRCASPRSTRRRPTEIVRSCVAAKRPVLYVGGGIMLADATAELREFVDHLQIPVAHTLMGKGALPDDHPLRPRHDRLLGHPVHQRAVPRADLDPRPRHALLGSRLQLVGARVHVQHSRRPS